MPSAEVAVDCTPEQARDLTERIRTTVGVAWELVKQAYTSRAWAALGYGSWDAYCEAEFAGVRLKLPRESRHEAVASLRDAGLSIRAIAAATGESVGTVHSEVSRVQNRTPDTVDDEPDDEPEVESAPPRPAPKVTGTDGKSYPAAKSPAPRAPRRSPLHDLTRDVAHDLARATATVDRLLQDDRLRAQKQQVASDLGDHLQRVLQVCQDLVDHLTES